MKNKIILWDFDGVILDSMPIRELGFKELFQEFDFDKVDKLLTFHRKNGGLSRYVKIKYFFEELLSQPLSDDTLTNFAQRYSEIVRSYLTSDKYLIPEVIEFIKSNHRDNRFHVVSGSDGLELRYLCNYHKLTSYFVSIEGSPHKKDLIVSSIIDYYNYNKKDTFLIGDSLNDFEAAKTNNINFFAINSEFLEDLSKKESFIYLSSIKDLNFD